MSKYNDLDMKKWKEYEEINTDSLWIIKKRDNTGTHSGDYHGNFVPQIPRQLMLRYTKKGDYILDPFLGSGTTLIEANRMGRNGIGIELQKEVLENTKNKLILEKDDNTKMFIKVGDSENVNINKILQKCKIEKVQFIIFHPPYWDIIKFSEDKRDLSNSKTLEIFLEKMSKVIDNTCKYLKKDRYCAVVIGDKYQNGEIIPIGFKVMNLFLEKNFKMKAIIVKNFEETKGKFNQKAIWRYRALANDFYIFKHEYIMVFKKVK